MNIKEAEKLSGVSIRNIRFYEEKGLLAPVRNKDNDYREYTGADIARLKMIRALRMVDIPLEQIKRVADGEVTMQETVAKQKNELKRKIKKIKTAIDFCDELEKVEGQNVEEVLERMDQPENKKILSDKWKTDFAEAAKKVVKTVILTFTLMLLSPYFVSVINNIFYLPDGYIILMGIGLVLLWGRFGYKLYDKTWWWLHGVLAHFPTVLYSLPWLSMLGHAVPNGYIIVAYAEIIPIMLHWPYCSVKSIFVGKSFSLSEMDMVYSFLIMASSFGIGMLLRWGVEKRKNKEETKASFVKEFFEKHKKLKVTAWIILVVMLLTLPASVNYAPYVSPQTIVSKARSAVSSYRQVKYDDESFYLNIEDDFRAMLTLEEWERRYFCFGFGQEVLEVGAAVFYSNDVVRLTMGEKGLYGTYRYIYCQMPEGTTQKALEYMQEKKLAGVTEESSS